MTGLCVLLVDDEREFTTALTKVLRRRGFEVTVAEGGEAALERIAERSFDAVVLDVKMPGRDGLDVLSEIKQRSPATEVILLTGHRSVVDERDGLRTGAAAYLLKPHPIPDLVARIEAAAVRSRAARGGGGA
ncbi:MAG: response regulator [Deltaproteobacteria bacterium]|nr:response regulator [Deltaproteobacteria bacterium]